MQGSDLVRRLGWSFLHQGVGRGAVFAFFALLPTWVSLEVAGAFVLAYTTMQVVLTPAFDTAVSTLLARAAAQGDSAAVRQLLLWAIVLLGMLLGTGLAVATAWWGFAQLWLWMAAYFAFQLPLNMAFAVCRGYGRFDVEGIVGSLQKVALLPLFVVLPAGESAPAQAMAYSTIGGWALFAVAFGRTLFKATQVEADTFRTAESLSHTAVAAPVRETIALTALATVALLYLRIDLVLLDVFSGARDVGIYSTASRWMEATFMLPFVFMLVLFPQLSSKPLQRVEFGQTVRLFVIVGAVTLAASLAAAWVVVPAIYDAALGAQIAGLIIQLSPSAMAVSLGMLFSQTLVASGRTTLALLAALVGLATKLVIAAVAIPRLGPSGAALAAVFTEMAVAITAGMLLRRVLNTTPSSVASPSVTNTSAANPL